MIEFILNDNSIKTDLPPGTTLLDFIRYHQGLKGTKIGCREGDCGACTVLVGDLRDGNLRYRSMTSCLLPIANVSGKHIVTIEGINGDELNPVQQAIVNEGATQCGFCTVGFVMSLTGYSMNQHPASQDAAIASMDGNICRCTGYKSLERVAGHLSNELKNRDEKNPLGWLIQKKYLPSYFENIPERLKLIKPAILAIPNHAVVAGGTDVYVQKPDELVNENLNPVFDQSLLQDIRQEGDFIHLGGSVTVTDIFESSVMNECFPELKKHLKLISSTPIRNMATIAGNFVNASPIGDMTIFFLALDAELILTGAKGERRISLRNFYKGYKSIDLKDGELVKRITFRKPLTNSLFNFEKVSKRTHLDIASVNSAISLVIEKEIFRDVHISIGGVYAFPLYLKKTSEFLHNQKISENLISEASAILQGEIKPISDARGSEEYKRLLARQLLFAHFIKLFPEQLDGNKLLQSAKL